MKIVNFIKDIKSDKTKRTRTIVFCSMIYNFFWSICKILFGVFMQAYFFCISGASSLLIGFVKKIYFQNYNTDEEDTKSGKSIIIGILLMLIGILFTTYMARLFFIESNSSYGNIMSITIALFSFLELGFAIYNFVKAKKNKDILHYSFRGCNLALSGFALVLTQSALLTACGTPDNFANALAGSIFGVIAIVIGIVILIKSINRNKLLKNKEV